MVEISAVLKTMWKSEIQNITKSTRELVESSAVWKTVWKSEFHNTTKFLRELVESSAVNGNGVEILVPEHHKIPQGIRCKLRCVENCVGIIIPKLHISISPALSTLVPLVLLSTTPPTSDMANTVHYVRCCVLSHLGLGKIATCQLTMTTSCESLNPPGESGGIGDGGC